jgi:anti-sigma-K factor RskA
VSHEELIALCGPYALGVLDPDDRQSVGEHLADCWDCRQRVLEFEETFAEGAKVLPPVQPSPRVKNQLMERISGSRQALEASAGAPAGWRAPPWALVAVALVAFLVGVGATLLIQAP